MVKLFSTNCPKCKVLEMKMKQKNIEYEVTTDVQEMLALGIRSAPILQVEGELLQFTDAVKWINEQ